jgi:hypothetical protein
MLPLRFKRISDDGGRKDRQEQAAHHGCSAAKAVNAQLRSQASSADRVQFVSRCRACP